MEAPPNPNSRGIAGLFQDLKVLLTNQKIWLAALVILIGYQIFWVTYSLAGAPAIHLSIERGYRRGYHRGSIMDCGP